MRSVEEIRNEIAQVDAEIASIKSRIANAEKYGDVPEDAWTAFVDSGDRSGIENYRTRIENEKQREIDRARMATEEKKAKAENVATAEYNLKKARAEYNQLERKLKETGATNTADDLEVKRLDWEKAYTDYISATGKTPGDEFMAPVKGASIGSNNTGNDTGPNEDGKALETKAKEALEKLKDISSKNKAAEIQAAYDELNSIYVDYDNKNDETPISIQNRLNKLNEALEERKKLNAAKDAADKVHSAAVEAYNAMDLIGQEDAKDAGFTMKDGTKVKWNSKTSRWVKTTEDISK